MKTYRRVGESAYCNETPTLVVCRVGDPGAPPLHSPDPDILAWIEKNDFMLITNNRQSMPRHLSDYLAAGRHVPGIFVVPGKLSVGRILDELVLIAGASLESEWQDQIWYLPIT